MEVNGKPVKTNRSVNGPAITLKLESGEVKTQVDIVPSVNSHHVIGGKEGADYVAQPSRAEVCNPISTDRQYLFVLLNILDELIFCLSKRVRGESLIQ